MLVLASLFARLAPLAPRSGMTAGSPRPCAEGSGRFLPAGLAALAQAADAFFGSLRKKV
jgi:hypothetical protein